jgi:hypothetical protein
MVFNATFNNISVLLVEVTGIHRKNHRPVASDIKGILVKMCLVNKIFKNKIC